MKKIMLAVLCTQLLCGTAMAQYYDGGDRYRQDGYGDTRHDDWRGGIRSRIREAEARIERGIDRGSLTRHEARRLKRELNAILDRLDRMRDDDGRLSRGERARLHDDLDRLERNIRREKHDDDRRDRDRDRF